MHSPARRAFLRGHLLAKTPWGKFFQRLRRLVQGELTEIESSQKARLLAEHVNDIRHARALCQEYGVLFVLDEISLPTEYEGKPVLLVRPGPGMAGFRPFAHDKNRWFILPGTLLGSLAEAGMSCFYSYPPYLTIAAWLADRTLSDYGFGKTRFSGVELANMVLADGTEISFGPFGEKNTRPLQGTRAQQLVSQLFALSASFHTGEFKDVPFWPLRYRLDALMKHESPEINLAHLFLGHGGDLAWLQWLVINQQQLDPEQGRQHRFSRLEQFNQGWLERADALDSEVKKRFDPDGIFPVQGQDL